MFLVYFVSLLKFCTGFDISWLVESFLSFELHVLILKFYFIRNFSSMLLHWLLFFLSSLIIFKRSNISLVLVTILLVLCTLETETTTSCTFLYFSFFSEYLFEFSLQRLLWTLCSRGDIWLILLTFCADENLKKANKAFSATFFWIIFYLFIFFPPILASIIIYAEKYMLYIVMPVSAKPIK